MIRNPIYHINAAVGTELPEEQGDSTMEFWFSKSSLIMISDHM